MPDSGLTNLCMHGKIYCGLQIWDAARHMKQTPGQTHSGGMAVWQHVACFSTVLAPLERTGGEQVPGLPPDRSQAFSGRLLFYR